MARLVIIRGIPGSGKSTLANALVATGFKHYEADMYHMKAGVYQWKPENVKDAHEWCYTNVRMYLRLGLDVVVSNTFTTLKEMRPYLDMAKEFGITPQIVTCQADFGNVHSVPEATLAAMKARWEDYKL